MAHTALNDEEIQEFFDTPGIYSPICLFSSSELCSIPIDELDKKIKTLTDFIRNSKHFIVYTGAGRISSFF